MRGTWVMVEAVAAVVEVVAAVVAVAVAVAMAVAVVVGGGGSGSPSLTRADRAEHLRRQQQPPPGIPRQRRNVRWKPQPSREGSACPALLLLLL